MPNTHSLSFQSEAAVSNAAGQNLINSSPFNLQLVDQYGNFLVRVESLSGVVELVVTSANGVNGKVTVPRLLGAPQLNCDRGVVHVVSLQIEPNCVGSDGRYEVQFQHTGLPAVPPFVLRFMFANSTEKLARQQVILQQKARVEGSIVRLKDLVNAPLQRLSEVKTLLYDGSVKINICQTELQANPILYVV
jgi:hypothetical protein